MTPDEGRVARVFGYYPGCELRTRARAFDRSARRACRALGIHLQEMRDWTCCGGLVPQVRDDYAGMLAPTRILVEAHAQGFEDLVALCAFCFNTLRRASFRLRRDPEARRRLGAFLDLEELSLPRVLHLLEVLRDEVGFDRIREAVRRPLSGLRVAPYYGCLLLRPGREVDLDDPEDPTVLEGLLEAMGCDVTAFRARCECCGSYHIVTGAKVVARCADLVLDAAAESGAQVLVTSCPVCQFNLDWRRSVAGDSQVPVVYFPQLLALALGDPMDELGFDEPALRVLAVQAGSAVWT
ncbi:MAG: CoB--CoM heterodisulfide reductase iron-sulfur subunit B family protein [Actinobacteria bacterium]|nr:CoB--CoM heterodisulfide reductase iron-sulfur subunit B family protein [Actinomycetota bacterium]